jgi:hypothetical protein
MNSFRGKSSHNRSHLGEGGSSELSGNGSGNLVLPVINGGMENNSGIKRRKKKDSGEILLK